MSCIVNNCVGRLECQGYKSVHHWLHLSPSGEQNDIQQLWEGGQISWRGLEQLAVFIITASCDSPAQVFGKSPLGWILQCDSAPSWIHWKVLMLDVKRSGYHLGVKRSRLILQSYSSAKRENESVAGVYGASGKWLVINTSDTPGPPSIFHLIYFCGLLIFLPILPTFRKLFEIWSVFGLRIKQMMRTEQI